MITDLEINLPWIVVVGYPRHAFAGRYLDGPRDPKRVRRSGYGFTLVPTEAWPFKTEKAALLKARIVERHMGWSEGVMIAEVLSVPLSLDAISFLNRWWIRELLNALLRPVYLGAGGDSLRFLKLLNACDCYPFCVEVYGQPCPQLCILEEPTPEDYC